MFKYIAHIVFIVILPFSGWGFLRKPHTLAALVGYLILLFVVMVLTRWITLPLGIAAIIIHLILAAMVAIYLGIRTQAKTKKQYAFSALFSVCVLLVLTGVFKYRESVLGINVFFIPSLSMTPTLQLGDIILVDILVYREKSPSMGDIVAFKRNNNVTYVKRVTQVMPDGIRVRGDNFDHSMSERALGKIPINRISGKVNFVLFNTKTPLDLQRFFVKF